MTQAQLINRGEQFAVIEGSTRFEGECVWSWQQAEGETPRRVSPITIVVASIHKCGVFWTLPMTSGERLRVARLAKQLLEVRDPECTVLLDEGSRAPSTISPVSRPAPAAEHPPAAPVSPISPQAAQRARRLHDMGHVAFAARIEGYLHAVQALKCDGTFFSCTSLGAKHPLRAGAEAAQALRVSPDRIEIEDVLPVSNILDFPATLKGWILNRVLPLHDHPLDALLLDGFRDDLAEGFGEPPKWYTLRWLKPTDSPRPSGAMWDLYLFGTDEAAFLLRCSWDD
ncbi:MAG: hypothetical protein RLZZ618_2149 [Pseudomonadota bacterium]|jgi:hypothetical protein